MSLSNQKMPSSPFPGMDPYLEANFYWRGFHHHLASEIIRSLNPLITPKYFADIELHSAEQELIISEMPPRLQSDRYFGYPDAPIERIIELPKPETLRTVNIHLTDSQKIVTAIELLCFANKVGESLAKYQQKRFRVFQSDVHLIEIDLLRGGHRPGPEVNTPPIDTDYIILSNSDNENIYRVSKIWPVAINEPLPTVSIPLMGSDPEVPLNLGDIVHTIYQNAYYGLQIDYTQPAPPPKLRPEMAKWWESRSAVHPSQD